MRAVNCYDVDLSGSQTHYPNGMYAYIKYAYTEIESKNR